MNHSHGVSGRIWAATICVKEIEPTLHELRLGWLPVHPGASALVSITGPTNASTSGSS